MEFDDTPGLSWELPLMAMMFGWRLWDGMPLCMLEIFICLFTGSECKLKPVLLRYQVRAIMCTRFQCLLIIFDSVSEVQTQTLAQRVFASLQKCILPFPVTHPTSALAPVFVIQIYIRLQYRSLF
jgi:hypothetical protein